ncbi:TVP38/TMEM64 family protein [Jannaschia formosa]|uniref:TVP38/TMEM64 family protein n=1 Tax=Jannaschia formosa TaxID=2259592 RepID=UPI000E1B73BB|nr:VTT domain-containing protein [Jannaschia formosa]TFL19630.1 TVP38/TMEM64 family protein [Jannaschia formosa]
MTTMAFRFLSSWKIWLWPVLLVGLALGAWLLPWESWVPALRDWVQSHGPLGWVVFVGVYVIVVILPLPAAAMSVVGGLAFGWWGYPLSMLGSVLGAVPPYLIGRTWLRGILLRRFPGPRVAAADRAIAGNAVLFVTLLRITPILPFTVQNWLLGLTGITFWPYCLATLLGLAPGTLAMVWIGEMGGLATTRTSEAQLLIAGAGLLCFAILMLWLTRVATLELRRAGFGAQD